MVNRQQRNFTTRNEEYKHLWKCNNGECVNADVNDSYQIMRKVYPQLFDNGVEGYLKDPKVIDIKIGRDKGDVKK